MAKGKEKKVSGKLNAEELENVAGGWCITGGISAPQEVKSIIKEDTGGGSYLIITTFSDGNQVMTHFDQNGEFMGSGDVRND